MHHHDLKGGGLVVTHRSKLVVLTVLSIATVMCLTGSLVTLTLHPLDDQEICMISTSISEGAPSNKILERTSPTIEDIRTGASMVSMPSFHADGSTASVERTGLEALIVGGDQIGIRWLYMDELGQVALPCAYARTQLVIPIVDGEQVIQEGLTNGLGEVVFQYPGESVMARVLCDDGQYVVALDASNDGSTFKWTSELEWRTAGAFREYVIDNEYRGIWSAFSAARESGTWLYDRTAWSRPPVWIHWPEGTWPHSNGDDIYIPWEMTGASAVWQKHVIMHEYAHSVHIALRNGTLPPGSGPDPHYMYSESSEGFALTEGWAEFFACAVSGSPITTDGSIEDICYADIYDPGDLDGDIVEGAVAAVLWDIYDGASDEDVPTWDEGSMGDGVEYEFDTFWTILKEDSPNGLEDIWQNWTGRGPALWTVFWNQRINYDLMGPVGLDEVLTDVPFGEWSNDAHISITLINVTDDISGFWGFSWFISSIPTDPLEGGTFAQGPNTSLEVPSDGYWYLNIRALDRAGNPSNASWHSIEPWMIDTSPPSTPTDLSSDLSVDLWMSSGRPTVQWSDCEDEGSGVVGYSILWTEDPWISPDGTTDTSVPMTLSKELGSGRWFLVVDAIDLAGNVGNSVAIGPFLIDGDAPSTELTVGGIEGSEGWYRSPVVVQLDARDEGSGVYLSLVTVNGEPWSELLDQLELNESGLYDIEYIAVDGVGNTGAVCSRTVRIDLDAPNIRIEVNGQAIGPHEYLSSATISLMSTDALSGNASVRYSLDSGDWVDYSGPITVSTNGTHCLSGLSQDSAGSVSSIMRSSFTIHMEPPVFEIDQMKGGMGDQDDIHLTITRSGADVELRQYSVYVDGKLLGVFSGECVELNLGHLGEGRHTVDVIGTTSTGYSISDQTTVEVVPPFQETYLWPLMIASAVLGGVAVIAIDRAIKRRKAR